MAPSHGTDGESLTQALLDDSDFLRQIVERTLQQLLEAEMTAHLAAERYERTEARTGHRNGYRPRTLHTRVGTLTLLVPQDRDGTFSTALFARYQRSEKALVTALMEMYLEGVSTRKVREVTEALNGDWWQRSSGTSKEQATSGVKFTSLATSWGWSERASVGSWQPGSGSCSSHRHWLTLVALLDISELRRWHQEQEEEEVTLTVV